MSEITELFHDESNTAYATIMVDGHLENWPIAHSSFKRWVARKFFQLQKKAVPQASYGDALGVINGTALFEGKQCAVHLRAACAGDIYYLDLCDKEWRAVAIDADGWHVIGSGAGVKFCRTRTMSPLPEPATGGSIDALWQLINIPPAEQPLCLAWLLETLRPDTAYPILKLEGEQGSAKSTMQEFLRGVVDPSTVPLRSAPRSVQDLYIAAVNNHVVSLNNVSYFTRGAQDALCQLSTGGGYAARELYTDTEEVVVEVKRPVVLNGIAINASNQDFTDRTVSLELRRIEHRRTDPEIHAAFEAARPGILGALLDIFSATLRELPLTNMEDLPRMADFALLGEASSLVAGLDPPFMDAYRHNRGASMAHALDACPVACALREMVGDRKGEIFDGHVRDLRVKLAPNRVDGVDGEWPKSDRGIGASLRRQAPALRTEGIHVEFPKRDMHGSRVRVTAGLDSKVRP